MDARIDSQGEISTQDPKETRSEQADSMKGNPDRSSVPDGDEEPTNGDAADVAISAPVATPRLSKNQIKKRKRLEHKMELKKQRKEQSKRVKHARALAEGRDLVRERQEQLAREGRRHEERLQAWNTEKVPLMESSFQVCIDCSFEPSMSAKEVNSLAIQMRFCYSRNKQSKHPCHLAATSVASQTLKHLRGVAGFDQWKNWGFTVTSTPMEEYYASHLKSIVYLTSDSEHVLTKLDNSKIYVIGGIVDRNRLRRAAIDRAEDLGIATARLPIDEHLQEMHATRVLTCNHVFDLLLNARDGDWKGALTKVLPERKGAKVKDEETHDEKEDIPAVVLHKG